MLPQGRWIKKNDIYQFFFRITGQDIPHFQLLLFPILLIKLIINIFGDQLKDIILSLRNNLLCLLIDDDEDDQELFALTLEDLHAPITLHIANNGFDGLALLQSKKITPDYIFLDLNMPRMNGKECLRLLKEDSDLQDIPVVIFSTSDEIQDIKDTKALGALDFISKPPLTSELTLLLQNFFTRHHPNLIFKP